MIAYFTASKRSGYCEFCGQYIEAKSPHRFWEDVDGQGHLRCTRSACTPTIEERSAEAALWKPGFWEKKTESPYRTSLKYPQPEMCSRCGAMLGPGDLVLYFAAEGGLGKDVLCQLCGDWYEANQGSG